MAQEPDRVEVHRTEDAMKAGVDVIAPQLGSDGETLAENRNDPRRLTRLNLFEIMGVAHFESSYPEDCWYNRYMNNYMNLKMSEEGHERSKLLVKALEAIGGAARIKKQKEDDRGLLARNIWARNKKPEDAEE
jgi:hypothetical protein